MSGPDWNIIIKELCMVYTRRKLLSTQVPQRVARLVRRDSTNSLFLLLVDCGE